MTRHAIYLAITVAALASAWPPPPAAAAGCAAEKTFVASAQHQGLTAGTSYTLCCDAPRADGTASCVLRSGRGEVGRGTATPDLRSGARPPADATAHLSEYRRLFASARVETGQGWGPWEVSISILPYMEQEEVAFYYNKIAFQYVHTADGKQAQGSALATPPAAGRPGGGPIEPTFGAPAGQGYELTLVQLGGTTTQVPMQHGSCGLDCGIHVLAAGGGNLAIPVKVGMTCPAGTTVVELAAGATKVLQADSGQGNFSTNVNLQPFPAQELEASCQTALGGGWALPDSHNNTSPTANVALSKQIKVSGRCSGWANTVYKDFPVGLSATCVDQSF